MMQRMVLWIDRISIGVGKLFAWCVVLLTLVVTYEVFMRYVLRSPSGWAYDAGYILYGTLFIMAGAYALATRAHVRADVVYRLMPIRMQASIDLVLYLLFFAPAAYALIFAGYHFAESSWLIRERSPYSPVGPPLYHFKALIPMAGVLLALQGIAEIIRCFLALRFGVWPTRAGDITELADSLIAATPAQRETH